MTPLQAVRQKCLWCCDGSAYEVARCSDEACPSWPFRFGRKPTAEIIADQGDTLLHPLELRMTAADFQAKRHSALKAIKRKCLDCSGVSKSQVRNCAFKDCALHPFRQGKKASIADWRLHDLRRTAVTGMSELGIRPDVIELCVNHISGVRAGVAGTYNRSELLDERRAALERWAAHIEGLVSGKRAKVVDLTKPGRK